MTILGQSLVSIPFISSTDSTRLQMSSKQIAQAVTHLNCEVPKVIGRNWRLLSETSYLFKYIAPADGEVLYVDDRIMVILLNLDNKKQVLKVLEVPRIRVVSSVFAMELRYIVGEPGEFRKGTLLYEYSCFKQCIPAYGYNLKTLYLPWFGFNHEDAIVISESCAQKIRSIKAEKRYLPIYQNSLFQFLYPESKYRFIPEIGQRLQEGGLLVNKVVPKYNSSLIKTELNQLKDIDQSYYRVESEISKLANGIISDIRVHSINKNNEIIHPDIKHYVHLLLQDYLSKVKKVSNILSNTFTPDYKHELLASYYIMTTIPDKTFRDCYCLVELLITQDDPLRIGDKLASRYANKGVIALIIPDELMPIIEPTNERVDIIINPLSIPSRMIIGQLIENIVASIIYESEKIIKRSDNKTCADILKLLSKLAHITCDPEYGNKILSLSNQIENDKILYEQFLTSVNELGLYFECPSFTGNLNIKELMNFTKEHFPNAYPYKPVTIKKETFKYMKDKLKLEDLPDKDTTTYQHLLTGITYFLRLKHEASLKITARDFGSYSSTDKQPLQGHYKGGYSSRIGQMELDALLAAGLDNVVKEIFTIKSDSSLKRELVRDILSKGEFITPDVEMKSATKLIIESLIKAIKS